MEETRTIKAKVLTQSCTNSALNSLSLSLPPIRSVARLTRALVQLAGRQWQQASRANKLSPPRGGRKWDTRASERAAVWLAAHTQGGRSAPVARCLWRCSPATSWSESTEIAQLQQWLAAQRLERNRCRATQRLVMHARRRRRRRRGDEQAGSCQCRRPVAQLARARARQLLGALVNLALLGRRLESLAPLVRRRTNGSFSRLKAPASQLLCSQLAGTKIAAAAAASNCVHWPELEECA